MAICGIYQITNVINSKYYIGSSVDLDWREYSHFYNLDNFCHDNRHLQSSYNKYGRNAFMFCLIEYCDVE